MAQKKESPGAGTVTAVRMSQALKEAMMAAAKIERRSVNALVVILCEDWLAARGMWPPPEPPAPPSKKRSRKS